MALAGEPRFAGRNLLITGAAGRLGRVIAARLAEEGAAGLCLVDLPERNIPIPSVEGGREIVVLHADLSDEDAAGAIVAEARRQLGSIDVLVNCAGAYGVRAFMETGAESWRRAFSVNLDAVTNISRALATHWIEERRPGVIVSLTSAASLFPRPGTIEYVTAKSALNGLTNALAMELGPHGIRVNAVAPGMVLGEVYSIGMPIDDPEIALALQSTPLGRTGRPEDVAAAVAFLASDDASWITGAILPVTGGAHFGRPHFPLAN